MRIFTTSDDIHHYACEQLERYCLPSEHDEAVDALIDLIRNAEGFAYGRDMDDLLERLWEENGETWPV